MTQACPSLQTLMKILIGTAWIDGKIQPEERNYLDKIAREKGIAEDPEIKPLLHEFLPVPPEQCYQWVNQYLGDRPTSEACQKLIEAISGLIYSDGTMENEEATLLNNLQMLDPSNDAGATDSNAVIRSIRKLYQHWLSKLE